MKKTTMQSGIVCPVCLRERGEPEQWVAWAADEYYSQDSWAEVLEKYSGDMKREMAKAAQAISLLGHFQDDCAHRHPKKKHSCGALIELGLYQSVEHLTRGLFHVAAGCPSPGLALARMALEVGTRSVLEEISYALISKRGGRPAVGIGPKLKSFVVMAREVLRRRADPNFDRCSIELLSVPWPDAPSVDGRAAVELDAARFGFGKVIGLLEDAGLFAGPVPLRARLDELYDELSVAVHQRKTALEVIGFHSKTERARLRDSAGWAIRGIPAVEPDARMFRCFREAVDIQIALVCLAQAKFGLSIGDEPDLSAEWRPYLRKWDGLPLAREIADGVVTGTFPKKSSAKRRTGSRPGTGADSSTSGPKPQVESNAATPQKLKES